ncbi:MAG: SDR family oxidoreductase [Spirochaetales bacterium]|nr:SDR family oxidoreductase [Spirochaetales bacterium]
MRRVFALWALCESLPLLMTMNDSVTESSPKKLAPAIRVNVIAPSLTRTKLTARLTGTAEAVQRGGERHPLQRIGEPEDAGRMAAYLLGDDAGWITGQTIGIDGGLGTLQTS